MENLPPYVKINPWMIWVKTPLNRILAITLFLGLAYSPASGISFEPPSFAEFARHLGIGFGVGYHARPCNPIRANYYDRVTRGAAPFGYSDIRLQSYDHTHPFYTWQSPIDFEQSIPGWSAHPMQTPTTLDFAPRTATEPANFSGR